MVCYIFSALHFTAMEGAVIPMIQEKNYDFRARHWQVHLPGRRQSDRALQSGEVLLDPSWSLCCAPDSPQTVLDALKDFQDYLFVSMDLSLPIRSCSGEKTLSFVFEETLEKGFVLDVTGEKITLAIAKGSAFRAMVYLEDCMNLEGAPVLPAGRQIRNPLYRYRTVHSGTGIDEFPDSELIAAVHAGYDAITLFLKGIDHTAAGYCNVEDLIKRAAKYELKILIYNYIETYVHPEDPGAQEVFDKAYGELLRKYPDIIGLSLAGESLEFPSKDPHTTGKRFSGSFVDGIPETKPSPGWYPCYDYPAYLEGIAQAVHKVKPDAEVIFETYNWGYAPLEIRKKFLQNVPKDIIISICYEIFAQKKLGKLHTPVMDYTVSTSEPGFYFTSECAEAHKNGLLIQGNVNSAGIGWDFGAVPYVPVPYRWLQRDRDLRKAYYDWGVVSHYATHHYGYWNSVAADLGKWSSWADFEPDYEELLYKIAVRDYGKKSAQNVLKAWKIWGEAMEFYTASNEDQYGPWRVGPSYPFIFHPNITRTLGGKEIQFPTAAHAHFGYRIIKTLYGPFENENQSPGFRRYPSEIRSLEKMLALWEEGLSLVREMEQTENVQRLLALGIYIGNSIKTTIHIKEWWRLNVALINSATLEDAFTTLDKIEVLAYKEMENARETIPAAACDSRLGWEPSMEYVCDPWHLEWKIRQVESALREIATYRKILALETEE